MIPERCKLTWATGTFSTQSAIPSFRLIDSRTFGDDHLCLSPNKPAAQSVMLTKQQRLRRATIAVVAPLHNEAPTEAFEERAEAIEHWRGHDGEDAPPM